MRYSLYKQAQASLNSGINLRSVVQLPEGEDLNDWIAVHGKLNIVIIKCYNNFIDFFFISTYHLFSYIKQFLQ